MKKKTNNFLVCRLENLLFRVFCLAFIQNDFLDQEAKQVITTHAEEHTLAHREKKKKKNSNVSCFLC